MQLTGSLVLLVLIVFILAFLSLRIPAVSSLRDNVLGVISDPIEVKMGCLSENVLAGSTVTESRCLRIT